MDDALLLAAARRYYELGRARFGLQRAALAVPLAALALYHCRGGRLGIPTLTGILALGALVALFSWRGEGFGRGVSTGLAAGLGPLLLPILSQWTGIGCSATVSEVLPAAAVAGGFLGGLALGGRAFGAGGRGAPYWLSATAVTLTLGTVGCLHAGLAGLGGMALGLLAGSMPALALRVLRAR